MRHRNPNAPWEKDPDRERWRPIIDTSDRTAVKLIAISARARGDYKTEREALDILHALDLEEQQ